ncbi:MAG TPA: HEAT repeat domain-containing protein [Gemmatimonadaceae bacterium]
MNASIRVKCLVLASVASVVAVPVRAQSLAQRVRAVGTGVAELHYTARPGTCGDGRESFSFGSGMHFGNWYGRSSDGMAPFCQPGPARVRLRIEGGTITSVRVSVGPARSSEERPTELGAVSSREAAAFFLALADSTEGNVAKHAITAAVLADSASVWPQLLAIATDTARVPRSVRHDATFWAGQFAAAKLAGNDDDLAAADDGDDRDDARSAAVFALSQLRGRAGVEPLLQVARTNRDPAVRRKALFWLGESGDPRAIALFREILKGG